MSEVILRREKVTIPTYEIYDYDKNPMFLEKRVYQGSSGRVYPHPVCEGVSDVKTDKEYDALFLENDYILVMILPEIGGRIQRLYDKTNGYDAVYYNEVIKPALVGLAGPWISGGIEFNWPQHHRPSTFDPTDCAVRRNDDGSVTVTVGETEKMFHTKGEASFTVYPDKAYLEIKGRVYNPTDTPRTFLWWANPAVAVNDYTKSIFPPDVHAVMDHGKRGVSKFPIADGVYYKVDYSPGTDISMYKNIPVPTSYMAYHSDYDFMGNYDFSRHAGLLHVADHHVSQGKKQWTWGCGDFGKAWDRNLTDENGPYIELMTGVFTDNQPDFTFLKPYEEKTFVQYFMPYKKAPNLRNASTTAALSLKINGETAELAVYAPQRLENAQIKLLVGGECVFSQTADIETAQTFEKSVKAAHMGEERIELVLMMNGREILACTADEEGDEEIPSPAQEIPEPCELETNEKLFLAAVHLEQYRHATRSPEPYYREGLRRDPSDIRLNNGYGKYLYERGEFEESVKYFETAIKSSVWKNPNPYDCEPYYNLGLALEKTGCTAQAYDAFYKATWDGNMANKAFYRLACLEKDKRMALEFAERSLVCGMNNMEARTLKSALLRHLGRKDEALEFTRETRKIDPLDHGSIYELYKLTGTEECLNELRGIFRRENHGYIELALTYIRAGLYDDASHVLKLAPNDDDPMLHYYLFRVTDDKNEQDKAENASPLYCFPNRLEDIEVLENAIENGAEFAKYYLGCLFYDKRRADDAVKLWESCAEKISFPTVYRNLSLAYYNKTHEPKKALEAMLKAFSMDETDARVFFELDQLMKAMNYSPKERLAKMKEHGELLRVRDDLYTEYVTLLNLNAEYEEAYKCIMSRRFHPWEGGEGKIPAQYRTALMHMGTRECLEKALTYPENLGEGKLIGNRDNDIYYMLGCLRDSDARKMFELAAQGEFDISSAKYYNDNPPEMMYYAALALRELGEEEEARRRFEAFIEYADTHMNDDVQIDYFAVSLPDFLIFDADLNKKNKVHCLFMAALGYMGLGDIQNALKNAKAGLESESCHEGLTDLVREIERGQ